MVTISHLVKKLVDDRPLLAEGMEEGIISFGSLAEKIQPEIEKELGKKVKLSAIVMALRRHFETLQKTQKPKFDFHSEIIMKTNLCDIAVVKSPTVFKKIENIHKLIDFQRGDTLNIIHGNNEISIVTNEKHRESLLKELKQEKIINKESNLVALSLSFTKEFFNTPGIISTIVRKLSWENVNIYEIVSTLTELTFIISKKDSTKAYNRLQKLVEQP